MTCDTDLMSRDRLAQRAQAGAWLREQRERRGYATAAAFASALGIDKSLVSNYETGRTAVPDDRAERIAEVLGMDIIEVRRRLGLWVPEGEPRQAPWAGELEEVRRLLHQVAQRDPDRVRTIRRILEALADE